MPKKEKRYDYTLFPLTLIEQAYETWKELLPDSVKEKNETKLILKVDNYHESWTYDTIAEFSAVYKPEASEIFFCCPCYYPFEFDVRFFNFTNMKDQKIVKTTISIKLPNIADVEHVFRLFEEAREKGRLAPTDIKKSIREKVAVYIGHGRNSQWRDLKDHLQDKHCFRVIAYETGARAGYTIAEILEQMSQEASIAFLVHTGENLDENKKLHARENVIHEAGLFQGKLGFKRGIILLEDGCDEYSNLAGVQQLRYSSGNIKEIFGDVISIIHREFGADE